MADKRPWAKIDTGYILNPKWFQIERSIQNAMQNAEHTAMQNAKRASMQAHLASVLYCARNQTDGVFPVRAIKAELDLYGEPEEAAITALFDAGLWINLKGGMAEVRDYLEHQTPAERIKETSSKRSEAARVGWEKRRAANANSNANSNASINANSNAEEKRREENLIADFGAWYAHYPKKVGKGDALKAFKGALKKTDLETLTNAAKAYAKAVEGKDKRYVKNPGPWLRDERWADELTDTKPSAPWDPWSEQL